MFCMQMKTQDEEGIKQSEDFYKMGNYEDKIYSLNGTVPGQTQAISQAVQKTLENNGGVGIMTGLWSVSAKIPMRSNFRASQSHSHRSRSIGSKAH